MTVSENKVQSATGLLPCPFCGGEAELITPTETDRWAQVNCKSCGCRGTEYPAETARAVAAWNKRIAGWRPIETRDPNDKSPCWIGDDLSETMLVARPARRLPNVWYILWADRMVPWSPSHWMPLPLPPRLVMDEVGEVKR